MDLFYDNLHFDKFNGENQIDLLSNSFSQIGSDLENKIFDCPIEDFIENKINKGDNTKEIKIISDINNDFHKDEKIRFIIKKKTSKKKKKLKNQKISKFIQGKIEIIKPIKKEEKKIISEKKLIGRKKKILMNVENIINLLMIIYQENAKEYCWKFYFFILII